MKWCDMTDGIVNVNGPSTHSRQTMAIMSNPLTNAITIAVTLAASLTRMPSSLRNRQNQLSKQ